MLLTTKGWDETKFNFQGWLWLLASIIDFNKNPQECITALFKTSSKVTLIHKKCLTTSVSLTSVSLIIV